VLKRLKNQNEHKNININILKLLTNG